MGPEVFPVLGQGVQRVASDSITAKTEFSSGESALDNFLAIAYRSVLGDMAPAMGSRESEMSPRGGDASYASYASYACIGAQEPDAVTPYVKIPC